MAGPPATYDAWNRLTKLTDAETAATVQENQYDGRYFRTLRRDYAEGTLDQTRHFYYTDDWRCVEERLDTETTPDRQFVWGLRYIDDIICRDRSTTGTLNERLYALPDGNWNVTALVNTSGAVAERLEYDPYGNTTWLDAGFAVEDGSQYGLEVTYCSYRWDQAVSMFQVRFRWYLPSLGMWSTQDPTSYIEGTNLYVVAWSAPMGNTDPFGLAVGHHYFPQTLLGRFFSQGLLTKGAFDLGMGYFSGSTNPSHRYGSYGGVSHKQYNDDVSEAFGKYLKGKGKKQANQLDLMDFIDTHLRGGDPVEGMDMGRCSRFNSAVDKTVVNKKGAPPIGAKSPRGWARQGRWFTGFKGGISKTMGFMFATGMATEGIAGVSGALGVASNSSHFKNALDNLMQGDLDKAEKELFGNDPGNFTGDKCFTQELVDEGLPKAAAQFAEAWNRSQENARIQAQRYSGMSYISGESP